MPPLQPAMDFTFQVRYSTAGTKSRTAYSWLWIEGVQSLREAFATAEARIKQIPGGHLGFYLSGLHDGERGHEPSGNWRNAHNERKRVKLSIT